MPLRMVSLKKKKNGAYAARKAIPSDVREAYARVYGRGWEEKLNIRPGTSPSAAKRLYSEWSAEIETRIETLRAEAQGKGIPLTQRDALALAGEWYNWFVAKHEDEPGRPSRWKDLSDIYFWDYVLEDAPDEFRENPASDPEWEWRNDPGVRERLRPVIVQEAQTALFLAGRRLVLNDEALALFLDNVEDLFPRALNTLELRAGGDYSADDLPSTFPKFSGGAPIRRSGVSTWSLFEAWVQQKSPAPSTVSRWRAVFLALKDAFPHAELLTHDEARAWIKGLITDERTPATVKEVWLPAARIVFALAVRDKRLASNPFDGITVEVPRKTRTRETSSFTDKEAQVILRAALAIGSPKTPMEAAKRWVPWLLAYTGARAGEMTQLRGSDIELRGDTYFAVLTPDAGTIKNKEVRAVPLHDHLIEQGFLQFVKGLGKGPLFYKARKTKASGDLFNPRAEPSVKARQRLGEWVRALGLNDPQLSPTHAWRDTFKARAERTGMTEKMSDYITGHAPATVGRSYGAPTSDDMANAMKRFPRYEV